jgi:hypothetical protein
MREDRKSRISWADVAGLAIGDLFGCLCAFLLFGKFWKVGLILLAVIAMAGMITGFVILWVNRWDI